MKEGIANGWQLFLFPLPRRDKIILLQLRFQQNKKNVLWIPIEVFSQALSWSFLGSINNDIRRNRFLIRVWQSDEWKCFALLGFRKNPLGSG